VFVEELEANDSKQKCVCVCEGVLQGLYRTPYAMKAADETTFGRNLPRARFQAAGSNIDHRLLIASILHSPS
jgi:hypothetical protein